MPLLKKSLTYILPHESLFSPSAKADIILQKYIIKWHLYVCLLANLCYLNNLQCANEFTMLKLLFYFIHP